MKHRLSMVAFACASVSAAPAWAQGYSVMGSAEGTSPPSPPPGAQYVVQPAPGPQASGNGRQTTVLNRTVVPRRPEEYGGVTPGMPTVPPGFRRRPRTGTLVAWPGFQMVPGGSRVFVVLTAPQPVGDGGRNGRLRVFHFPNARIALSNNRRPLITEAFDTPVSRAYLRPSRGGSDLVMELRADLEPTVSQETNGQGYHFVFFTFPAFTAPAQPRIVATSGDARPVLAPSPPPSPPPPAVSPPVPPPAVVVGEPRPATDTERPPGIR